MRFFIVLAICLLCAVNAAAEDICANDGEAFGCYDLHGSLRLDSDSKPYLRSVDGGGTFDVAGTSAASSYLWPANLAETVTAENEIFGRFRVCPIAVEEPGETQIVCINSASNLVVRPDPSE